MTQPKPSDSEHDLVDLARRVLPAGGFGNMAQEVIIASGRGGRVWDMSGNEYVDYLLGSGPMLVGHAHRRSSPSSKSRYARARRSSPTMSTHSGSRPRSSTRSLRRQGRFVSSGSRPISMPYGSPRLQAARQILKFEGGTTA